MKRLFKHSIRQRWTPFMRSMAVLLALNLALLPLLSTANTTIALFEERGNEVPPVLEEEILKHVCELRISRSSATTSRAVSLQLHQYQDLMLDHPVMEVPHQPPKLS